MIAQVDTVTARHGVTEPQNTAIVPRLVNPSCYYKVRLWPPPGQLAERSDQPVGVLLHAVPGQGYEQVLICEAQPVARCSSVPPNAPLVVNPVRDGNDLVRRKAGIDRKLLPAEQVRDRHYRSELPAACRRAVPAPVTSDNPVHAMQIVHIWHACVLGDIKHPRTGRHARNFMGVEASPLLYPVKCLARADLVNLYPA